MSAGDGPLVCSAKGCPESARWELRWNNPRLHTPDRRKTWLACDDHKEPLSSHLDIRGFLRGVEPLGTPEDPGARHPGP